MPIGPDPTRSPRISTALIHYWSQATAVAERAGLDASASLGRAVTAALQERFPDAPSLLPVFPAFRSVA